MVTVEKVHKGFVGLLEKSKIGKEVERKKERNKKIKRLEESTVTEIKKLSRKKLTNKKILSKGKRAVVVVNVPHRERREIKNIMQDVVEQDRRNFFFK